MTPSEKCRILDDLYDDCGSMEPCLSGILNVVESELRARVRRRRIFAGTLCGTAVLAGAGVLLHQPVSNNDATLSGSTPAPPVVSVASPAPVAEARPFAIDRIDDDELLKLLDGQPVGLATLPDGSKSLLMVSRH